MKDIWKLMMMKHVRHKISDDSYVDYIPQGNFTFILYKDNYYFQCMQGKC